MFVVAFTFVPSGDRELSQWAPVAHMFDRPDQVHRPSHARKRDTNSCIPLLLWWSQSSVVYVTASVVIPKQTAGIMSTVRVLLWSQSAITRPAPLRFAISKTEDSVA